MKYKYISDIKALEKSLKELKTKNSFFNSSNNITEVTVNKNEFICKSHVFKAVGISNKKTEYLEIDFKVSYKNILLIPLLFFTFMMLGFLFSNNVIINQDVNPSILKRIGFVLFSLLMFSPIVFFYRKLKIKFKEKIINQLNLEPLGI